MAVLVTMFGVRRRFRLAAAAGTRFAAGLLGDIRPKSTGLLAATAATAGRSAARAALTVVGAARGGH